MTTGNDLAAGALRLISSLTPGEAIPGEEADHALTILNGMLKAWSAENLMVPYRTLENFSISAGIGSRTIGSGAQLNTTRPDYVTGGFLRDSNSNDHPLSPMTKEEYNAIPLKSATGRPRRMYYDTQYPNGILYFDLVTDAAYTLYLESLKPFNQFTTLATSMDLPGEYEEAAKYLLAERLAPEYGFTIPPDTRKLIEDARKRIYRKNTKPKAAAFDVALGSRQPFNIYTG